MLAWDDIDPNWRSWSAAAYRNALLTDRRIAEVFNRDFHELMQADVVVALEPHGLDAAWEAGFAAGRNKRVITLLADPDGERDREPEIMNLLGGEFVCTVDELIAALRDDHFDGLFELAMFEFADDPDRLGESWT